jgi:hypothetical protein
MTTPYKRTDPPFVIPSGGMGLRPTYEDENGFGSATSLPEPPPSPLSSRVLDGPGGPPKKMNMRPEPHARRSEADLSRRAVEGSAVRPSP